MKPVDKGAAPPDAFTAYDQAKPHLLSRIGLHCSYCEREGDAQDLHVEHIYPKDPHPELERDWNNFLVACSTCNNYKHQHLRSVRQVDLESRYLWPHRDNTFKAFKYFSDGRVKVDDSLPPAVQELATGTIKMAGLLRSPTKTANFNELAVAYDGFKKRDGAWGMAKETRVDYDKIGDPGRAAFVARQAAGIGHFSIWMEVFSDRPEVRRELITAFKADPNCFDAATQPVPKGRL